MGVVALRQVAAAGCRRASLEEEASVDSEVATSGERLLCALGGAGRANRRMAGSIDCGDTDLLTNSTTSLDDLAAAATDFILADPAQLTAPRRPAG